MDSEKSSIPSTKTSFQLKFTPICNVSPEIIAEFQLKFFRAMREIINNIPYAKNVFFNADLEFEKFSRSIIAFFVQIDDPINTPPTNGQKRLTAEHLSEYILKLLQSKVKHGMATLSNMGIDADDYDPPLTEVSAELEGTLTTLFFNLSKYRKIIDFSVTYADLVFDAPSITNPVWRNSIRKEKLDLRELCEDADEMEIVLTAIKGLENTHWYGFVNNQKPQRKLEFIGSASSVKVMPTISTRIEALCAVWDNKCYITEILSIKYPSDSDTISFGGSDQFLPLE